jgi:hypothetical protein
MNHQQFTIGTIFRNERFENLKMMLDTLEHLEKISETVFKKIDDKVTENKNKLMNVQKRTNDAKEKVKTLIGRTVPTLIYSPNVYPEKDTKNFDRNTIFKDDSITFKTNPLVKEEKKQEPKIYNPINNYKEIQSKINHSTEEKKIFGLGKIPNSISSCSNLLLYNTSEFIYKTYKLNVDPLLGVDFSEEGEKQELNIDDPPASLVSNTDLSFNIENISYKVFPFLILSLQKKNYQHWIYQMF